MKNKIGFLFLVATIFFTVIKCFAADLDTRASLEAAATNDLSLRAAVRSYYDKESALREKFEEEIAASRKSLLNILEKSLARSVERKDTDTAATLARVISDWKRSNSEKNLSSSSDAHFVGSVFQWAHLALFLAPNGVCWSVVDNKDGMTIHKNLWRPEGENSVFWEVEDKPSGRAVIEVSGEEFLGKREDGAEFRGKIFKSIR